jgi:hypothetical protein
MSREQIGGIIGVTVGSLQVTCSRLGISLRRPRPADSGVGLSQFPRVTSPSVAELADPAAPDAAPPATMRNLPCLTITMTCGDRTSAVPVPLPQPALTHLVLQATFRGMRVGELVGELLTRALLKA